MRITDNMRLNTAVGNMFNIQSQYSSLMEKIATQKKVNRASDDPITATKIIDFRQGIAANEQYRKNIAESDTWISLTESTLSGAHDLLAKARAIALDQAAGMDEESRKISAQLVQSLIDQLAGLANSTLGNRYLFSGSKNGAAPFSTTPQMASIEVEQAGNNVFQGAAVSSATYSGTTNKIYTVKITTGGSLDAATAQISTDGGSSWNGTDLSIAGGYIDLGDGAVAMFDAGIFIQDDIFYIDATAANHVAAVEPDVNNPITSTGTVASSGTYSGTTDKAYTVEITTGGALGTATFQFSTDGGPLNGIDYPIADGNPIDIGDGVFLTFADHGGAFGIGDRFLINASAEGTVEPVEPDVDNSLLSTGTVASSATYSGTVNKSYVVKITGNTDIQGNTIDGVNTAQISTDGGRTWNVTIPSADGDDRYIHLGDNVKLKIADAANEIFGENDIFVVNAVADGYYQGNDDQLSVTINRGVNLAYNITGAAAFTTGSEGTGTDVFKTLNDLKNALDNNDADGISSQLERLQNAQDQLLLNQSLCGTTASHTEMAKNSLNSLDGTLTSLLSDARDAQDTDIAEYATKLSMQQIALQASYSMAARIGNLTILNFLK